MKTLVIAFILLNISSYDANAQTLTNQAAIISCGGRVGSQDNYVENICIGLPCVGLLTNGTDSTFLGLAFPPPPGTVNGEVLVKQEKIGNLFPNPSSGIFTMQLPPDLDKLEYIVLLDDQGNAVRDISREAVKDGRNVNCKLPPIPDGAYFLRVESRTQALLYKVLVRK